MRNIEKDELRRLCKEGLTFSEIRGIVNCSDATIKRYIAIFSREKRKW